MIIFIFKFFLKLEITFMDANHGLDIGEEVGGLLKDKKYKQALELVRKSDVANSEEVSGLSFQQKCEYYFALLKSYYHVVNRPKDYVRAL